ncbi:DUF6498-containing protein [Altibacter lentus]|uniref:DUF6498-containing protein n=1 Tax=Altibacter lentus TaxID=1223410 RepID=UPI00054E22D5|nr:DUF6498-containing protein [Altibacter lentus]
MIRTILLPNQKNMLVWANALFLLALLFMQQIDALTVVFAYFLETIVIGLIHILKLWIVSAEGKPTRSKKGLQLRGLPLIFFFVLHYGMFVAIQSIFAFTLFESAVPEITSSFALLENYGYILSVEGMPVVLASLVVTNLSYFYTNFWKNEKYKSYTPGAIFMKPYVRIFVQQFVVILAFFFYLLLSTGVVAAVLLIVFRLLIDLTMVSLHKDSETLEKLAKKYANSPDHYEEMKRKYQEFSE